MGGEIVESIHILITGLEFQAGYGVGLMGDVNLFNGLLTVALGSKIDLVTFKLAYDEFDIGQEEILSAYFSLANSKHLSVGKSKGSYTSGITGRKIQYDIADTEVKFEIANFEVYTPIGGVGASVTYDYTDVSNRLHEVWNDWDWRI